MAFQGMEMAGIKGLTPFDRRDGGCERCKREMGRMVRGV